ncbi:DNA-binding SARP family transcriptional activator [Pseudonocardia sediminis]|uniref:DNA-binding SARP family transcriptional activator n=1 Tax=Pseudonocardia sediminis TaxID=1397368 RepID=A0A4Q7UX84_PSEST|nr:BTAD domain-containing putative transcriptional regulator [Pseudonocardia sediminis]RZT86496.1 DNA-binding SARP family transcriptional activator [Pseudonocardia sediminis]
MSDDHRRSRPDLCVPTVRLLGSFALHVDTDTIPLPVDSRRLVAYLAVHRRPQPTAALAADLWPGVNPSAAARLLDEAVAAVDVPGLLTGDDQGRLALCDDVAVDLSDAMLLIRALSGIRVEHRPDLELLESDILPSWTASWIAVERERFRQLRLSAMESLSAGLTAADQHDDAIAVARRVVAAAPSRERSRRVLVEAMLAGGDVSGAMAEYTEFQELLRSSIGATTDSELDRLLAPLDSGWPLGPGLHRPVQRWSVGMPGVRGSRPAGRRLAAGSPASGR